MSKINRPLKAAMDSCARMFKGGALFKRLAKSAGFSLIELLVVIAIIGVLAAVAIPAYRGHQRTAAQGSIIASLRTIGKSFATCLSSMSLGQCNTLDGIEVDCPDCDDPEDNGGMVPVCVDIEKEVAGVTYKACVSSSGGVPSITRDWASPCKDLQISYTCQTGGTSWALTSGSDTCSSLGCQNPTQAVPASSGATCTAGNTTNHACTTANAADQSTMGQGGECQTTGSCS